MFHTLRGGDDGGVQDRFRTVCFQDLCAFLDQAHHALALVAGELGVEHFADLLQALDLAARLLQMVFDGFAQRVGGCVLDHLGQRLDQLCFGAVEVFELDHQQVVQ